MSLHATKISSSTLQQVLSRYPGIIKSLSKGPEPSLQSLDKDRLQAIPQKVSARDEIHMTKSELQTVLACKMKRGKFRPALSKFAAELSEEDVKSATAAAFAVLPKSNPSPEDVKKSLKELTKLRGIGVATASYILGTYDKQVPVFSDEAFRWICWDGKSGWEKKIKYDMKEYEAYLSIVQQVAKLLGSTADEVERAGWVLGKEKAEIVSENAATLEDEGVQEAPPKKTGRGSGKTAKKKIEKPEKQARKRKQEAGTKDPPLKKQAISKPEPSGTQRRSQRITKSRSAAT